MSKQLTLSIAASLIAMSGFVLVAATSHKDMPVPGLQGARPNQTGATIETAAPALDRVLIAPADISR